MDNVTVTRKEYDKMQRELSKLAALEAGGVDNWEWYDESLSDWFKENEVDELVTWFVGCINELTVDAEVGQPTVFGCEYSITLPQSDLYSLLHKLIKDFQEL